MEFCLVVRLAKLIAFIAPTGPGDHRHAEPGGQDLRRHPFRGQSPCQPAGSRQSLRK